DPAANAARLERRAHGVCCGLVLRRVADEDVVCHGPWDRGMGNTIRVERDGGATEAGGQEPTAENAAVLMEAHGVAELRAPIIRRATAGTRRRSRAHASRQCPR